MEGVVIRAKKGIVTVSVVSNDKGEFSFPAAKLGPATYTLSIRATGYDLTGPSSVTLAGAPLNVDLKLVKAKNIAAQLTNLEWITSVPGTERQKNILSRCVNCHTLERIMDTKHDAAAWKDVINRMATYSNNSFHLKPQMRKEARDMDRFVPNVDEVAAYLASINRSTGEFTWQPKTVPRVKGSGTRVVITEYDLPDPTIQPHDVIVDNDGIVWHSDFSGQMLGRFDTKTLAHKAYPVPLQREGWPTGALDLQTDPQGNLWLGLMFQAGTAKFDRKTEKFQMFQLPPHCSRMTPSRPWSASQNWTVDNRIWLQDPARRGIYRMDMTTGQTELFEPFKIMPRSSPYSIFSDQQNNVWFLDFGGENVGTIDANSGEVTLYPTPTRARGRAAAVSMIRAGSGSPSSRRTRRRVRHQEQAIQGMAGTRAVFCALRRRSGQARQYLDRRHERRPHPADLDREQRGHRISAAARDQHPPRVRRQQHHAADLLGRQQPRRRVDQARAAGLRGSHKGTAAGEEPAAVFFLRAH